MVRSGIVSTVMFPANILPHIQFPPLKVHGVDLNILFLETALSVSLCIFLK